MGDSKIVSADSEQDGVYLQPGDVVIVP